MTRKMVYASLATVQKEVSPTISKKEIALQVCRTTNPSLSISQFKRSVLQLMLIVLKLRNSLKRLNHHMWYSSMAVGKMLKI